MEVIINGVQYIKAAPKTESKNIKAALNVFHYDCGQKTGETIRNYLRELLSVVWIHSESFDGRRPFGNSGWRYDLLIPLAMEGLIDLGELDPEDGEPYSWSPEQEEKAMSYVGDMIIECFRE